MQQGGRISAIHQLISIILHNFHQIKSKFICSNISSVHVAGGNRANKAQNSTHSDLKQ